VKPVKTPFFIFITVETMSRRFINILLLMLFLIPGIQTVLHANNGLSTAELDRVLRDPTFNKRMEGFSLFVTPEQMEYFLDNLPHATLLLNEYGIHTLKVYAAGVDRFRAEDGRGLEGSFVLLKKKSSLRKYAGTGSISSSVISRISADVVAQIGFEDKAPGEITGEFEFWVRVDGVLLDLLCRIFRPVLLSILTKKFDQFVSVIQQFTERVREDPEKAAMILLKNGAGGPDVEEFRSVFPAQ
jgi:hypothetical protein